MCQCGAVVRPSPKNSETEEEFGIQTHNFKLFEVRDFPDRLEYTFWQFADFDIQKIKLTEGLIHKTAGQPLPRQANKKTILFLPLQLYSSP